MQSNSFLALALAALLAGGCTLGSDASTGESAPAQIVYESPEQERYCKFADQFAQKLHAGDYTAAHAMCSSHIRNSTILEQFTSARQADLATFGKIRKIGQSDSAETDANLLRGPKHVVLSNDPVDAGITKMEAAMTVGEIPDSVPLDIRRAAVQISLYTQPPPQPGEPAQPAAPGEEEFLDPNCYLHVVIVEESGQLKVGHFCQRWHRLLD